MREIPTNLVRKKSCDNTDNLCYHLKPYSSVDIAQDNKNSSKEKALHLKRYKQSCSNRNGIIKECCSKNKKDVEKIDKLLKKLKKPYIYGKTEYNQQGELESIQVCDEDKLENCEKGYRKLNSYEMCKIPDDVNLADDRVINKFVKDCFSSQCNPQERLAGIDGSYDDDYTFEFDKHVSSAIKSNNLSSIQHYITEDPKLTTRALTNSADGNTIYHEAFKYNAKHILVFLFKTVTQSSINQLNSKGETLLHMAMKTDNPNAIQMCLKLGANINAINNYNETPIYNAIREQLYNNVLVCLNKYADIYHKNKAGETPFIVACETPKRHLDIVRLLVNNGANIDDLNKDKKTILQVLLEKENLNAEDPTRENKEAKDGLDLNIEDEKIRTFLQNIKVKKLGLDLTKELSVKDTKKLEGILYTLGNKEIVNQQYDFTLNVDFSQDLEHPEDLHYPKDLGESFIKPYREGKKEFSHEPYYLKYKDMHQDKLVMLKKIIQLTKWDSNKTQKEKTKIIDDIMTGKKSLDSYKYRVFHDNGITQEQDHLLENIDEDSLFDFKDNHKSEKKILEVKSKRTVDEEGTIKNTPFDISYGTEKELLAERKKESLDDILTKSQQEDYNELLNSPDLTEEEKKGLFEIINELLKKVNINIGDNNKDKINSLQKKLENKTKQLQELAQQNHQKKLKNRDFMLSLGIGVTIIAMIVLIVLLKKNKIKVSVIESIRNYGG